MTITGPIQIWSICKKMVNFETNISVYILNDFGTLGLKLIKYT